MAVHFHIECDWCDQESYVSREGGPMPEPEHCPMCGEPVRAVIVSEEEDAVSGVGEIIDM